MTRFAPFATCLLAISTLLMTLSCGGGNRTLKSVALNPASADAKNFTNGQVPFTAIGTFSKPPSPITLTSKDVAWCIGDNTGGCAGNILPGGTVDTDGVAQCGPSFTGTLTVLAGTGSIGMGNPDGGSRFKVFGSAQLTCP